MIEFTIYKIHLYTWLITGECKHGLDGSHRVAHPMRSHKNTQFIDSGRAEFQPHHFSTILRIWGRCCFIEFTILSLRYPLYFWIHDRWISNFGGIGIGIGSQKTEFCSNKFPSIRVIYKTVLELKRGLQIVVPLKKVQVHTTKYWLPQMMQYNRHIRTNHLWTAGRLKAVNSERTLLLQ